MDMADRDIVSRHERQAQAKVLRVWRGEDEMVLLLLFPGEVQGRGVAETHNQQTGWCG